VLGLAHPHTELFIRILPVPDIPKVLVNLTRPKELVRRREGGHRSTLAFRHEHSEPRLEGNQRPVCRASEVVLLWLAALIPPDHPRHYTGRKPFNPASYL